MKDEVIKFKAGNIYRYNVPVNFTQQDLGPEAKEKNKYKILGFDGTAYSGNFVEQHLFFDKLIIDVESMSFKDRIPVLKNHTGDLIVGDANLVKTQEDLKIVNGRLMDVPDSEQIRALADQGFRWELSIGAKPRFIQELREGEVTTVNGKEVAGPVSIFRDTRIVEVSFVAIGADSQTDVNVFNNKGIETTKQSEDKNMKLEELQLKFDKLTHEFACACEEKKSAESRLSELEDEIKEKNSKIDELNSRINENEFQKAATDAGLEIDAEEIKEFSRTMDIASFVKIAGKVKAGFSANPKKPAEEMMSADKTEDKTNKASNASTGAELTDQAYAVLKKARDAGNDKMSFSEAMSKVVANTWSL